MENNKRQEELSFVSENIDQQKFCFFASLTKGSFTTTT